MPSRRAIIGGSVALAVGGAVGLWQLGRFPPDTQVEGAYLRIASGIQRGDVRVCFAYLEEAAQHAAHTIRDYRRKASERIEAAYPEPERSRLLAAHRTHATAEDGADVWVDLATARGWIARLRRDLSGIARVEATGDRATVETARGARYTFRRRPNGIWGLTLFTAELAAEAERAARDWQVVEMSAADYERARE